MNFKESIKNFIESASANSLKNWIEELLQINDQHSEKIERLEAQIRKLQGLPSKPKFKTKDKTSDLDDDDDSGNGKSGGEKPNKRKDAAGKNRRKKKELEVDLKEKIKVSPSELDATFQYKGTRKVVVQDILFQRNNIEFELEKYYSKEHGKTVEADLPPGYDGGYFGPHLIAYIKCNYYEGDVTIKKLFKILTSIGIKISIRQINRIINDRPDELVYEAEEARLAAIQKVNFQQIDDAGANIFGHTSAYTTVTCNPYFTALYTTFSKNRRNAVMALSRAKEPLYKMNLQAILVAFTSLKSLKIQHIMEKYKGNKIYSDDELTIFFEQVDFKKLKFKVLENIKTAMLVGAFYDGDLGVTGKALVSDDAPQFNNLYDDHGLCWYHELRHYKELDPVFEEHRNELNLFFTEVKQMYQMLKKWVQTRDNSLQDYIFTWFNKFFREPTSYRLLNSRKKKTLEKMDKLLAPLWTRIKLPLTNNESERDIRGKSIKKKISLFDRSRAGILARDFYIGFKETCRKNGVSFYQILLDRAQGLGKIPQLAEIING